MHRSIQRVIMLAGLVFPGFGAVSVSVVGTTQTQAVLQVTGATGGCSLEVSTAADHSSLVDDVDGAKHSGAGTDTSRADTIVQANGTRLVTIGHQEGKRALQSETHYYARVCGTATTTFDTPTMAVGTTQFWPVPFDPTKWGNRGDGFDVADLVTKRGHVDPSSGMLVNPAGGATDFGVIFPGGGHPTAQPGTTPFGYWDQGTGWSTPEAILTGGTASTSNSNPLDLYPSSANGTPNAPPAIDIPLFSGWSLYDLGLKLKAGGTGTADFVPCYFCTRQMVA